MSKQNLSIESGVKIASKHTNQCAVLMAKYLYPVLVKESWFDQELRVRFCLYFLKNLCDMSIEKEINTELFDRVKSLDLKAGIKLLRKHPDDGLKVLVAIVTKTLRDEQKLSIAEQQVFYNEIFGRFFPDSQLKQEVRRTA